MAGSRNHAEPRAGSQAEFARAERNSRLVRRLKVVLPVVAILIVIVGAALVWVARSIPGDLALAGAAIKDGKVVIEDPRMSGVDNNDRPFELVAARAMQTIVGGAIDLEAIDATVSVSADTTAKITASQGHYDPGAQLLSLDGGLKVVTTDGLTVEMNTAKVDLTAGILTSDAPISVKSGGQSISANAITVSDNGQRIKLSGGVSMLLLPGSGRSGGAAQPGAQSPAAQTSNIEERAALLTDPPQPLPTSFESSSGD